MDATQIARVMVMVALNRLGESGREQGGSGMDAVLSDGTIWLDLDGNQFKVTVEPVSK